MTKKISIERFAVYGGLITIFFEWLAVLLFYISFPSQFSTEKALSYFDTFPQTRIIFAFCLSIAAISFWIFTKVHLSKYFITPVKVFTFSMITYLALAIIPFDPNITFSEKFHSLLAFIFTASFIWGIYFFGWKNGYKKLKWFSIIVASIATILTIVLAFAPLGPLFLFTEMSIGFTCQLWIIGVSFYSYRLVTAKK